MTRVRIFETPARLARALARHIARALAAQPALVLGLATGKTPIPLYRELVRLHAAGRADFGGVTTFNLDEFFGVSAADPRSYRAFMQRHLFDHVNLAARRIHFLNGAVAPGEAVERECDRYERAIDRSGGIDLLILGLGINGHIGFNEPARALAARTHCSRLSRRRGAPTRRSSATRSPRSHAKRCRWGWRRSCTPADCAAGDGRHERRAA
jgi:glucosamine-6-phosphate deaminase